MKETENSLAGNGSGVQQIPIGGDDKEEPSWSVNRFDLSAYTEMITENIELDAVSLYHAAKSGEKHGGVYRDAQDKSRIRLEKSIVSHTAQVIEHAGKIANPSMYDTGWSVKDERARQGLIKKWKKDLRRNAEQASIEMEVWKERFGNDR